MWQTYRRRFLFIQVPILAVCLLLRLIYQTPWPRLGLFFALMQLPGVLGAYQATRVQRKLPNTPPPQPRNPKR